MKNFFKELNNKPLSVKLPLVLIFGIVFFSISIFIYREVVSIQTQNEVKNLNFKVGKTYFETKNKYRSFFDNFVILELNNSISKEQFESLSFDFNPETVRAELVEDKIIKVNFLGNFEKSAKKSLIIRYKNVEVYRLFIENSEADKGFFESFPPDSAFENVKF
jgi:hypothetical protein